MCSVSRILVSLVGYFEDKVYYDEIKSLFETRCPMCNVGFKTLNQLSKHVKDAHKLQYW